jgi:hypothetical protein
MTSPAAAIVYVCGHGHQIVAWSEHTGEPIDLRGYLCPVCCGAVVGHEDLSDSRILAIVQKED